MKVTVCFGNTRILVPVGEGSMTVAQLTDKSIARYRKISKKDPNEKICVHNIHSEAGILDLDDALSDVVADKDVLVAEFEEETPYTAAPPPEIRNIFNQVAGESSAAGSDKSAERTKPQNINGILDGYMSGDTTALPPDIRNNNNNINDSSYFSISNDKERMAWIDRWVQDGDPSSPGPPSRSSPTPGREQDSSRPVQPSSSHRSPQGSHQSPRSSQQSSDRAVERKIDGSIPERGIEASRNRKPVSEREIGGAERGIDSVPQERGIDTPRGERGIDSNVKVEDEGPERGIGVPSTLGETTSSTGAGDTLKVEIKKDNLPLGCNVRHIDGRSPGLYIMSIEEGSAAEKDGRLKLGDKILEVNGVDLSVMPMVSVLDVYNEMTTTAQVRLAIQRQPPGSVSPAAAAESCPDNLEDSSQTTRDSFEITLFKGQKGLGFTIATREYTTCPGFSPLFVKTVHRHGAAAVDGRMKSNDVLLKVNGKSVVGMPQQAVVAMIRELKGNIQLTLQRHTTDLPASDVQTSPPREPIPPPQPPPPKPLQPTSSRTRLSLDIPLVAPDGRPVGLGISVKGKSTSIKPRRDYGIFIKSILKGGAADLDGRVKVDDQLIAADGQIFKGLTNKEAVQSLKQALERSGKLPSLSLIVSRKDCLNMSAERRTAKPYSSFKDSNQEMMNPSSLASDPNKYRALSLSSPNLGRKKKHKQQVEFDGGRGVAFSEDIQSIPQAGDFLESDEDVVFVGHLGEQADPFNRDHLFRKSMKKIDHGPITPNTLLRRASSHDSLARPNKEEFAPILKKGVSQESVFSGKDTDPVYDTLHDETQRGPPKINDSLIIALQNGKAPTPTVDDSANTSPASEDKPKSKNFLNFFSKKGNKKKDEPKVPLLEPAILGDVPRSKGQSLAAPDWDPSFNSSPMAPEGHPCNKPSGARIDRDFSTPSRANVRGVEREQPRAPGSRGNVMDNSVDHKRSKSSDFFRDKETADRNGGFIEHRLPTTPRERDLNMSRGPDRHSNRSSNSGGERKRGDRPPGHNNYPSRDYPVRDPSRDHPVRDHPVREHARDHPTREHSRDHLPRDSSRDPRDNSRDPREARDRRYMETVHYRYGRGSPHHNPPPPFYLDQQQDPGFYPDPRFAGSNTSLNKRPDPRPPQYQPMIPHPISHLQGRHTPEQLSDV
ncbi:partitioning defective 3 homolog isoform X4 [Bolinopsis microptera]|uniref:partitioning defective 3 homolog isoform X4 n=1 Tax=Bolinopsis microptera TaxID=2820187 RepID=UPI00307AF6CD